MGQSSAHDEVHVSRRVRPYSHTVFAILFAISFLNYLDRFVLTGAANKIGQELNISLSGLGFISSAFLIVYTFATIPLGLWADRGMRKNVIAGCVAIWSIATALTAFASNFTTLFLSRMFLGIGEAGYFPAGTALLSDYFDRRRRSLVMSWWSTAEVLGVLGGFAIGGGLAGMGNWRLAFLFTGVPGLILAFLSWRMREPRRNQADEEAFAQEALEVQEIAAPADSLKLLDRFKLLLRIRTLVVLILMQVFAFFVLGVNINFLPTYLQQNDTFHFRSGDAGIYSGVIVVLAGGVGTVLGGYMAELLNRRYPGARILVCGIGFLLAAPAFAFAVLYHNLTVFTIFFILTALLLRVYTGPCNAATQDVVPSALRASAVALSLLLAHLFGDAFAPALVGVLATSFDPTHGQHFQHNLAGQDLSVALFITCTPALILAGLIGIFGARWMKQDMLVAQQADHLVPAQALTAG